MMTSMPRSFWMETRMLCKKAGKRKYDTEWRIYDSDDISHGFFRTPLSYSLSNLCMQIGSPGIWKKTPTFVSVFSFISSFLSSRAASGQVLSAFVSLTSVFGMDTGDPHSYRHCFSERLFSQNHIEEVLKLFACLGVSKLRPRPISFMSLQALRLFHS